MPLIVLGSGVGQIPTSCGNAYLTNSAVNRSARPNGPDERPDDNAGDPPSSDHAHHDLCTGAYDRLTGASSWRLERSRVV